MDRSQAGSLPRHVVTWSGVQLFFKQRTAAPAVLLYATTLFFSAALLFCVQPMAAKMLLPLLGGASAVWTTCMVFFQAALLGGYLYAHASRRWLSPPKQTLLHAALLLLPLAVLPIHVGDSMGHYDLHPITSVLFLLVVSVGLPFFVLSASAPLLQHWFSRLHDGRGQDPYFLYAASNTGSMLALVAYPVLIEPHLDVAQQSRLWKLGYVALIGLFWICAWRSFRAPAAPAAAAPVEQAPKAADRSVTAMRRLRWVGLAFVPSSLLLGVTSYVTTDLAAVPLFWVVPLALYLASFILVFAARPPVPHAWMVRLLPLFATGAALTILGEISDPLWLLLSIHLVCFWTACMVCHGELAADRPSAEHLTEFYLWMSTGGVLGGLFNAVVAPVIANSLVEYPLMIVVACICRPAGRAPAGDGGRSFLGRWAKTPVHHGLLVGGLTIALYLISQRLRVPLGNHLATVFVLPLMINYAEIARPVRFALGLGAVLTASTLRAGVAGETLHSERNFFGVLRVTRDESGRFRQIIHGRILHGRQSLDPALRREPSSYYHPTGPVGDVFSLVEPRSAHFHVAVIGLGAGAMAHYARPEQSWTFYEINPAVVRVATDPSLFTYLADSFPDPTRLHIELGDARLRMRDTARGSIDVLALDAFSSDSIPAHLLTREALDLYLDKLAEAGILLVHLSNRYLDLAPVVGALAEEAGLAALVRFDAIIPEDLALRGKTASIWVALSRRAADIAPLRDRNAQWVPLEKRPGVRAWTDGFSDVLSVLR